MAATDKKHGPTPSATELHIFEFHNSCFKTFITKDDISQNHVCTVISDTIFKACVISNKNGITYCVLTGEPVLVCQ